MTVVDTTVWINYLGGADNVETAWLDRELNRQRLGLTDLILCEVLQGVRDDRSFEQVRRYLSRFEILKTCGEELAVLSARNYRVLRTRGYTVRKTIDCLIATYCAHAGHELLHRDRDFDPFEQHLGLRVIHPAIS